MKPVISRFLGIVHLSDEKKSPYIKVGDQVKKGQVLARVETMNITNDVKAEKNGVLTDVMIKEGSPWNTARSFSSWKLNRRGRR